MRTWIVVGLSCAALAVAGCGSHRSEATGQRVAIEVTEKGFEPQVVTVQAGAPVTLVVKRTTDRTCATELVMKEKGINQPLPLNQEVEITFTADHPGDLQYACAMDMYRGTVRVK